MASDFYLRFRKLTNSTNFTLANSGASRKQILSFWIADQDFECKIIDSGSNVEVFSNLTGSALVDVQFDGSNWELFGFKKLFSEIPDFESMGLVYDMNPLKASSLVLSGIYVVSASNSLLGSSIADVLDGSDHAPTTTNGTVVFSGETIFTPADQYLVKLSPTDLSSIFSCSGAFSEWTIFVVSQLSSYGSERSIVSLTSIGGEPSFFLYSNSTSLGMGVYSDYLAASNGASLGSPDLNTHVMCITANTSGKINGWLDDDHSIVDLDDVEPKTITSFSIGSVFTSSQWREPLAGVVYRVMIFSRELTESERESVQDFLSSYYLL